MLRLKLGICKERMQYPYWQIAQHISAVKAITSIYRIASLIDSFICLVGYNNIIYKNQFNSFIFN